MRGLDFSVRDAVESALSGLIRRGTQEQIRLAAVAANEIVAGRNVEIAGLAVSLRTVIRGVLELDAASCSRSAKHRQ